MADYAGELDGVYTQVLDLNDRINDKPYWTRPCGGAACVLYYSAVGWKLEGGELDYYSRSPLICPDI